MTAASTLPAAYVPSPECGHCYDTLSGDGDGYSCESCGLYWSYEGMDEPATFLDDEAAVCGASGRELVEVEQYRYRELPCPLPEDHRSDHLHDFEELAA